MSDELIIYLKEREGKFLIRALKFVKKFILTDAPINEIIKKIERRLPVNNRR
jgi:hypothetical protein